MFYTIGGLTMKPIQYIYNVNYDIHETSLCALEVKALFNHELKDKVFLSNLSVNPSISPFLKNRFEVLYKAESFDEIVAYVASKKIDTPDFMVKYIQLEQDDPHFKNRRVLCKEVGLLFISYASYENPKVIYAITYYNNHCYLGILTENDGLWREHNNRPHSYSSSLGIHLAKALTNIAGNGDFTKSMVDPCCGVGTVLLEAVYAGYDIKGWEIVSKVAEHAKNNLAHFDYHDIVSQGDIQDIKQSFDVSIIDLPYGILSKTVEETQTLIIRNAKRISNKIVLVSSDDITEKILNEGLTIIDSCEVRKNRNHHFVRYVWVCQ